MTSKYVSLARQAVEKYVKFGEVIEAPKSLNGRRAGVFVSLHLESNGELRGCIGTFLPTRKNLAEEIINNAIAAASEDPRFEPVSLAELTNLDISVDILTAPVKFKPQEIKHYSTKSCGLIVAAQDGRRGLLLPDLAGVESFEQQERICRQKAGIRPDESVEYWSFTVQRYRESQQNYSNANWKTAAAINKPTKP